MEIHEIEYDGKVYRVNEPTIQDWSMIITAKSYKDDFDLALLLLSMVTGLDEIKIKEASASSIITAAEGLIDYYTNQAVKFYETFEFKGKTYKFIDLPNMSFGEYVDIDDLLTLPESKKNTKLHLLLALFYREVDDKGNYLDYDIKRIEETAKDFLELPVKYLHGSSVFFYNIQTMLEDNTPFYFYQKNWWILRWRMIRRKMDGAGMQQSFTLPMKTFYKWTKWLRKTTFRYLTF